MAACGYHAITLLVCMCVSVNASCLNRRIESLRKVLPRMEICGEKSGLDPLRKCGLLSSMKHLEVAVHLDGSVFANWKRP
ncbi:uncharacterized protein F4822DRAFT_402722 [Hypoxylon trugodes]|uniref:uncharacterized protein n=1 Tax=Hypoxylon trugodes TaxID=326681 RepID=UPI00218CF5BF|nr:uncharacterized protein F4822DRAFT_402722 [Hypoxylon trugodes]KAI1388402.1 hypothetical protein F4822DRAFT_402722 [Hypoxylon trugodes]